MIELLELLQLLLTTLGSVLPRPARPRPSERLIVQDRLLGAQLERALRRRRAPGRRRGGQVFWLLVSHPVRDWGRQGRGVRRHPVLRWHRQGCRLFWPWPAPQ